LKLGRPGSRGGEVAKPGFGLDQVDQWIADSVIVACPFGISDCGQEQRPRGGRVVVEQAGQARAGCRVQVALGSLRLLRGSRERGQFAAPMPPSLTGYARAIARAAAQAPCPAAPQIDQQVTIGGAAASLIGMTCPSLGGVYMLTAATRHKQTAVVFVFEDTSGVRAAQQADRVAFRALLAGVRFR
jgi:hypothetical protein